MTSWNKKLTIEEGRKLINAKGAMYPNTEWNRLTIAMAADEVLANLHGVDSIRFDSLMKQRNALNEKLEPVLF